MSEEFKIEIVNPEKSFLTKDDVLEAVVPAFEGEMGILKDHISIISFLKPGIIKILSKNKLTCCDRYIRSGKDGGGLVMVHLTILVGLSSVISVVFVSSGVTWYILAFYLK